MFLMSAFVVKLEGCFILQFDGRFFLQLEIAVGVNDLLQRERKKKGPFFEESHLVS